MSEWATQVPSNAQRETCLACRQSKVKCDRSMPACGRCVRLGIACMDSAPSRRGRSRTVGKKTAALQQLSGRALDSVARGPDTVTRDIQDTATRGGTVSIEHIREWMLVALARDSSTLFARASLMASQGGIQLSDVFAVPTMSGACCAVRSECCGFHERLPPGNPFARRFAAQTRVTPQLISPQSSPLLPAGDGIAPPTAKPGDDIAPPAAKRARPDVRPGAISASPAAIPLIHLADACDCACDAGDKTSDTRRDDAASKASGALASAFPAHLPRAARALLRGPYNEAYAWFRVCVDGAIRFGATAVFEEKVRSRTEMAAHFALNTSPVPFLFHDAAGLAGHTSVIGRLYAELAAKARVHPGSMHIDCRATMGRTMLKGRTCDVPCDVELVLSCYAGGRATVIAQVYHPLSAADRPVCPATAHSADAPLFDENELFTIADLL